MPLRATRGHRTPDAVGVVLAGGRSSRLGRDKALVRLDGPTLAERAVERLRTVVGRVVVADRGRGLVAGVESLPEPAENGPAGGILAARAAFPGRPLLVLACDLPFAPGELLELLLRRGAGCDLALPRSDRGPEPAVSCWGLRALAELERRARRGRWALHEVAEASGLVVDWIGPAELRAFGDPDRFLMNVNRLDDLERARELAGIDPGSPAGDDPPTQA